MENKDLSSASNDELIDVIVPHQGLTVSEGKIVRWLKQVGATVVQGEVIAEVETDKAVSEIESPVNGVVEEICVQEDQIANLGEKIAVVKKN